MNRDPILFRVDAGPQAGYENLARCVTFAAALQRRRRPTFFLSQLEPASLALPIKRVGNEWLDADAPVGTEEDLTETIQEIRRLRPAAVIVDSPNASTEYLKEIQATGALLVSLDHAAANRFPSEIVINPLLGPSKENYEFSPGTQLLLGPRYTLVRSEIRRQRPNRSQEPPPVPSTNGKVATGHFRALVALGEDDPHRKSLELVKTLLNVPRVAKVDVVARNYHPDLEKMQAFAAANEDRVSVAVEPAEITAKLVRCHFAVTAGSGWSLELACVGIPQLLIVQSEPYWPTAQRLEEEGCATCLGWHESVSATTIRQAVQNLLNDPLERQAMARCGRQLIDGRGPDRLVTALEIVLHPS
ncbi:MAG TPA: polysaccharide biosynthesis protein, partial [Gemmataceae bacterium]|nr:polysaccharide biosynthesis protein [Gemmataceae bacterium]